MRTTLLISAVLLAAAGGSGDWKDTVKHDTPTIADEEAAPDEPAFIRRQMQATQYREKLAQLAIEHASSDTTRAHARRRLHAVTQSRESLRRIAEAHHVTFPENVTDEQRATLTRLERLPANEFDAAVQRTDDEARVAEMADVEKMDVSRVDPALRDWMRDQLSALRR
jgi:predicted outer membrane protein